MKDHIPKSGYSVPSGLYGLSLCGKYMHWATGDHQLIFRLAKKYPDTYCKKCIRRFSK